MRYRTKKLTSAELTLTSDYQYVPLDLSSIGSLGANMQNVVAFHFVLSSGGSLTFKPQELFTYQTNKAEEIGWSEIQKDDGSGVVVATELATALLVSTFSLSTTASSVRVGVKGSGTLLVYATVAQVH